jgi:uncharacterized protein
VGVSVKAIGDWLSVLEVSNQIVFLEPWFRNISKRMAKSPKVYFCDSGLLSFLLGVNPQNLKETPFTGQIWETLVFAELRKLNHVAENPVTFWFYRDQQAREIDFVIEHGGFLSFTEAKWTESPDSDDIKTIMAVDSELRSKSFSHQPGKHYLINKTTDVYSMNDKVEALGLDSVSRLIGEISVPPVAVSPPNQKQRSGDGE